MDQDQTRAPAFWATDLARSDEDIARGHVVAASVVRGRLLAALAELEAEIATEGESSAPPLPGR